MKKKTTIEPQLHFLFDDRDLWPSQELFPLNLEDLNRNVRDIILNDIRESESYLIITGFTSLSQLVETFGDQHFPNLTSIKIVLGFEPNVKGRKRYSRQTLEKEIKDYWLEEGFSIRHGSAIIKLIEKINKEWIIFRYKDKNHSKLYIGDNAALLGSSNFSKNGLTKQEEANIRIKNSKQKHRKEQYVGIKTIAYNYYKDSKSYNDKIIELLKGLIGKVTWQEALARAINELLDGQWLGEYKELISQLTSIKLWPTQLTAIGQALSMLQDQSTVLIADPTGAGKTRLCTAVCLSLKHYLISKGETFQTNSQVICPPLVVEKWGEEARGFGRLDPRPISTGLLSNSNSKHQKMITDSLNKVNILLIDEAHNFLTPDSNRTLLLKTNQAQFKILVTATPISKNIHDLYQLIRLSDVDNLSDQKFEKLQTLIQRKDIHHNAEVQKLLREFCASILLRRTKRDLNKEIEKHPENYCNDLGKPCKFPKQNNKTYKTYETATDKAIVRQINQLISQLKGVTYLLQFNTPSFELTQEESKKEYIQRRITSGPALAAYMLRSSLRSSHVALIEHIEGTTATMNHFGFKGKKETTGNLLNKLERILQTNRLPRRSTIFKKEHFPEWLTDEKEYKKVCKEEITCYKKIAQLAKKLSGERELGKVKELINISRKHKKILAFDSTVITIYYLKKLVEEHYPGQKLLIATGSENSADSRKVMDAFNIRSNDSNKYIALCSDKMSESVDLQKASAVVLLDMPPVLRIVEQRIGRVDRMDSLHKEIDIYWPDDSEEYALKSDSRLITTNLLVENIYGSNIDIPKELREKHFSKTNSLPELIKEYTNFVENDDQWMGVEDSFQPVIKLKEGPTALINESLYEEMKGITARIRTRVSFIKTQSSWCFVALKGNTYQAPRWYLIEHTGTIQTHLPAICEKLRQYLTGEIQDIPWNETSLNHFINLFQKKQKDLLPHKKRRALEVMEYILTKKKEQKGIDRTIKQLINQTLSLFSNKTEEGVELEELAFRCIQILQPYLHTKTRNSRKNQLFNLNSLKSDHKKIPIDQSQLTRLLTTPTKYKDIDKQIVACIVGVGN